MPTRPRISNASAFLQAPMTLVGFSRKQSVSHRPSNHQSFDMLQMDVGLVFAQGVLRQSRQTFSNRIPNSDAYLKRCSGFVDPNGEIMYATLFAPVNCRENKKKQIGSYNFENKYSGVLSYYAS
jgi:hypothetical protein